MMEATISAYARLRDMIDESFDLEEFRDLCLDLSEEYDNLPGETKKGKAGSLVNRLVRKGRIDKLVRRIIALRPKLSLDNVSLPELVRQAAAQREPVQVFLCYTRQDRNMARRLYQDLHQAGVMPWLDCEDLLPGQKWRDVIDQAIRDSQYVLVLLSRHSVSHQGFIQKELRKALAVVEPLPPEQVFVIPVRLDDCDPLDDRLQELHWVDLFPQYEDGLRRILRVVRPDAAFPASPLSQSFESNSEPASPASKPPPDTSPKPKPTPDDMLRSQETPPSHDTGQPPPGCLRNEALTTTESSTVKGRYAGERRKHIGDDLELTQQGKVILDRATGLMWQQASSSNLLTYAEAQKYINELNRERFAGFDDWRLPTVEELLSLMEEKSSNGLYINPIFKAQEREWCWSADKALIEGGSPSAAWGVGFRGGGVSWSAVVRFSGYVRAVRP